MASATGAIADKPPLPCRFGFRLLTENHIIKSLDVDSLKFAGDIGYSHMNCFSAGTITVPKRDTYVLEITNGSEQFKFQQANFSLERNENPSDAAFTSGIAKVVSCLLLGLSALMWFLGWIHSRRNQ